MPLDEIVFQRERVRRSLRSALQAVDHADASYDPEEDAPMGDMLAVTGLIGVMHGDIHSYAHAVVERVANRKGVNIDDIAGLAIELRRDLPDGDDEDKSDAA